jgi:hypothetical protein
MRVLVDFILNERFGRILDRLSEDSETKMDIKIFTLIWKTTDIILKIEKKCYTISGYHRKRT